MQNAFEANLTLFCDIYPFFDVLLHLKVVCDRWEFRILCLVFRVLKVLTLGRYKVNGQRTLTMNVEG